MSVGPLAIPIPGYSERRQLRSIAVNTIEKGIATAGEQRRAGTTWAKLFAVPLSSHALDAGLLLLRIAFGLAFVLHGWPKIQHPFTWSDRILAAPPGLQLVAAIAEFVGGIAILLGLATRLFAFLLACDMLTAIVFVQIPQGARFVAANGGRSYELAVMYAICAIVFFIAGPGRYAIDRYGSDFDRK